MGSKARFVSLFALAFTLAAPAWADPTATEKETARNLMDEGRDLRDKGDNKSALARFAAADQIMRVPTTAYEVASTEVALGMLVEARETLARVLSSQPKPGEPVQFKEARTKAQNLDDGLAARIPTIVVSLAGASAGARIDIDGVALPSSVVGLPSRANPGHHVLVATSKNAEGREEIDLRDGEKKEITITLVANASAHEDATPNNAVTTEQPKRGPARTIALVFFGLGGASLVAGGITGALTFSTQSDLTTKCPNHICGPESHDELTMANTVGLVSTITFIGAGVFGVAGLVTWIAGKPAAAPSSARIEPWIGAGTLGVRGAF